MVLIESLHLIPDHKVIGVKIHNHFDSIGRMYNKYIFCLLLVDKTRGELCMDTHSKEIKFTTVRYFGALTHVPHRRTNVKVEDLFDKLNFKVKFENLQSTRRGFEKVPLWIFVGASALGKSFLAHSLNNLTVFESDAYATLPDLILEDVVVLGNKYPHTVDDILQRVYDRNVVLNTFETI